jgi:hypothetical protein
MKDGRRRIRRSNHRQEGAPLLLLAGACILSALLPARARAQAADSITITWTAPADDPGPSAVSRYDIRLSGIPINDANFTSAPSLAAFTPSPPGVKESFVVRGLTPGRVYWLAIRSADRAGNWSALSNVLRWPPSNDTAPPPTPSGLTLDPDPDGAFVQLTWDPSSAPDLAGYSLYRSADPNTGWVQLNASPMSGTSFVDDHVPAGSTRLYYAVTALDWTGNESARSASVAVVLRDAHVSGPVAWRLLPAYPNPAPIASVQHLPLEIPPGGGIGRLEVFDAGNQLVRRFEVHAGSLGATQVDWDGRNDHGATCAPGVYRLRLTAGAVRQTLAIARVP